MAQDINKELSNIYSQAKNALTDDLRQNFYNALQARNQTYRQLNNSANAQHAMFSGMPAAQQMQYDQNTFLPNTASMAANAIAKQQQNQESWDNYMKYVKNLQSQADYYNNLSNKLNKNTKTLSDATASIGGLPSNPMAEFSGNK